MLETEYRNPVSPMEQDDPQGGAGRVTEIRFLELCSQGTQDKTVTAIEQQTAHHLADRVEIGVEVRTLGVSRHQSAAGLVQRIFFGGTDRGESDVTH